MTEVMATPEDESIAAKYWHDLYVTTLKNAQDYAAKVGEDIGRLERELQRSQGYGYERGFLDGAQHQMKSSVDKAVNAMSQSKQEPVAWMTINEYGEEDDIHYENPEGHLLEGWTYKPLYTAPPAVLAQKEPFEYWPVADGWVTIDEVRQHFDSVGCGTIYKSEGEGRVPLYSKREWVELTDEEVSNLSDFAYANDEEFVRNIEAKLKEKNT